MIDQKTGAVTTWKIPGRGFSAEMLSGLVLAELATVVTEPIRVRRGLTIMVERFRITDAGRRAIEG